MTDKDEALADELIADELIAVANRHCNNISREDWRVIVCAAARIRNNVETILALRAKVSDYALQLPAAERQADEMAQRVAGLEGDAGCWRGLINCDRIRLMGFTKNGNHLGVEFWRGHPEAHPSTRYPQDDCRDRFTDFARAALKEKADV